MSKQIKLNFNSSGVLTSTNIDQIRQGDADVKLIASFAEKNNANYVAKFTLTRPDSKVVKGMMSASATPITDYERILDSAYYFAVNGAATLTVFLFSGDQVLAQGQATISIEQTDFDEETTITPDEYNELLELIATKLNIHNGIVHASSLSEYDVHDFSDGQLIFVYNRDPLTNVNTAKLYQVRPDPLIRKFKLVYDFEEIQDLIPIEPYVEVSRSSQNYNNLVSIKNRKGETLFSFSISILPATQSISGTVSGAAQTFGGVKTFADLPQTKEGREYESDRQFTDKGYVDNKVADAKEDVEGQIEDVANDLEGVDERVEAIEEKLPAQATSQNKLADRDWVNSTINSLAAFYITKNAQGDPFDTLAELRSATVFYSGGSVRVPTRNDYCLVRVDEEHQSASCRYIYQGGQWEFQFVVNETAFTEDQVKAINSGITQEKVAQIETNKQDIADLDENKLSKIEATQKFQSKIVSVDISISPSDWDDSKHFQSENVFGTLGFVNTDDTFYFVGISTEDDIYINTFRLDVVDVSSSDAEHTYVSFNCGEIPTETINVRIGLIKKNAIFGDMVGYLNIADLDGTTIAFQNGKVRVIGSGVQVDATQVEVTTTHTSVQANIIRIDEEINRVENSGKLYSHFIHIQKSSGTLKDIWLTIYSRSNTQLTKHSEISLALQKNGNVLASGSLYDNDMQMRFRIVAARYTLNGVKLWTIDENNNGGDYNLFDSESDTITDTVTEITE